MVCRVKFAFNKLNVDRLNILTYAFHIRTYVCMFAYINWF